MQFYVLLGNLGAEVHAMWTSAKATTTLATGSGFFQQDNTHHHNTTRNLGTAEEAQPTLLSCIYSPTEKYLPPPPFLIPYFVARHA